MGHCGEKGGAKFGCGGMRRGGTGLGEAGEAEALELDAHDVLELLHREGLVRPAKRAVLRDGGEV